MEFRIAETVGKIAQYTVEPIAQTVGKIARYTVEPIARPVDYVIHYKINLENLQTEVDKLCAAKNEVKDTVHEADVGNWKTRVDAVTGEANKFLKYERHAQTKCLHHFCPNLKIRYHLSRKSIKLKDKLVKLSQENLFTNYPYDVTGQQVHSISTGVYKTFDSRISTVNRIMDELRNPNTDMVVVRGVSGVGKTTIAEQIHRKAYVDKLFDDVVMIRGVKQNPDLERIQKEIATKLDLDILEDHTLAERAPIIYDRIRDKKTLVILDDVWEEIDLVALGLPRLVSCKILFTCRRKLLSLDMRMQKDFSLDLLDEEESWSLFEKMAGDVVKIDPIRGIATEVAKRCGGLPVLVVTVASALKDRESLLEWTDALKRLIRFDREGLTAKAYFAVEWNYSKLEEQLKQLLLLCADTIVNNNSILLRDLLKYGMGLDLFKNTDTLEEAHYALQYFVEKLKDFSLLLNNGDDTSVRMHDLVRDVATRIASRDHHVLSIAYGGELKVWPDKKFFEMCTRISLDCCSIPRLPEVLQCPKLEMFFLGCNDDDSLIIPGKFFEEMTQLKVLDLTKLIIPSLPPSLQFLKNLQTLCLDRCKLENIALVGELRKLEILSFMNSDFTHLPKQIGHLTNLRLLDLANCSRLKVISPNVLSSLKSLEDLRMRNSFKQWEGEGVIGERSNASLSELKRLIHLTALEIHIPNANILPIDLFSKMYLERYQILIGDAWKWDNTNKTTLKVLKLATSNKLDRGLKMLLKKSEVLYLNGTKGVNYLPYKLVELEHLHARNIAGLTKGISEKVVLANLTNLSVDGSHDLKFLLSCSMARGLTQLKHLRISTCAILEEVVSTEGYSEENAGNMFCKLEHLELRDLPHLARFCSGNYVKLISLEKLDLENCTELGGFISDRMSKSTTSSKENDERDSKENKLHFDTAVQCSLFDEKVSFPLLKRLAIDGLGKLMTIWHTQIAPDSFRQLSSVNVKRCDGLIHIFNDAHDGSTTALKAFDGQNLNSVEIGYCGSLKNIFPASMARVLHQLEKLKVVYCGVLEEIVAREETNTSPPEFVFPRILSVEFRHLPQLTNFYPGMHISEWPLLEQLEVYGCHKVEIFAAEFPMFQGELDYLHLQAKMPLFFIKKHSFPNLEYLTLQLDELEIWYGPDPVEFFRQLKSIDFYRCAPFSQQAVVSFLQKLDNLEKVEVGYGPFQELFVDEGNDSLEIRRVQSLPRVRFLRLDTMYNLRHLGKENSESAGSVFPDLEILDVQFCQRLKNLESSAISFQNLIILKVHSCGKLEYLTTQLIAKSLMQLTRLEVVDCERMSGIILASNAHDDEAGGYDEIAFIRLEHLQFHGLPRLQGFCLGNCVVKFPYLKTVSMSHRLQLKIFPGHESLHNVCITYSRLDSEVDDEEPDSEIDDDGSSGTSGDNNDQEEDNDEQ